MNRVELIALGDKIDSFDFDTVFTIEADGRPIERRSTYAPEVTNDETEDVTIDGDGWEALTGMTGQHGYSGAVMHSSENIGYGIADRLWWLAENAREDGQTAVFALVTVDDPDDGEPIGWAVVHRTEGKRRPIDDAPVGCHSWECTCIYCIPGA